MTLDKAIEILNQHPEIIEAIGDKFMEVFNKATTGQQLDFILWLCNTLKGVVYVEKS